MAKSSSASMDDLGRLILRVALGVLILLHGIAKLRGGIDPIIGMVGKAGLPAFIGYGVYVGEVLAPVLLILGLVTRPAAAIVAFNMVVAIYLAHSGQLVGLSKTGGWQLELQGMYLFSALAVALLGAGRFSLGGSAGRMN